MRQVRLGVFETNSSSTHSLTICSMDEYNKWKAGTMVFDRWGEAIIPLSDMKPENLVKFQARLAAEKASDQEDEDLDDDDWDDDDDDDDWDDDSFLTFSEYENRDNRKEEFSYEFTSPSGDKMIAFGEYGYDS